MNFKTRSGNITKVLYIVLVLCVISILFLSVYSMFNSNSQNDDKGNLNSLNLGNGGNKEDSGDALSDSLRKSTTEAPTQTPTERPTQRPTEKVTEKPTELPAISPPAEAPTDRTADIVIEPVEPAVEVISVPAFYVKPVAGYISKSHNPDTPEYSIAMNDYRTHVGIDIDSEVGVNVKAVADGTVSDIYGDPLMGMTVVIDHANNLQSVYMNLQELLPKNITVGAAIKGGEVIGGVGESALIEIYDVPHLHFEMKKDGNYIDPLDYIDN